MALNVCILLNLSTEKSSYWMPEYPANAANVMITRMMILPMLSLTPFLTHGLWFLGFHGHNMLDTVIKQHFTDVTAGIFSKTMQDVFVLLGGAGAMLCLVTAILLFARKKDVRHLASMAAPTVIFNISEIALFGIPVIFNPIFLVPIANFLITYGAIYSGIVPHVVNEVDWTTPILLSGYQATGS